MLLFDKDNTFLSLNKLSDNKEKKKNGLHGSVNYTVHTIRTRLNNKLFLIASDQFPDKGRQRCSNEWTYNKHPQLGQSLTALEYGRSN